MVVGGQSSEPSDTAGLTTSYQKPMIFAINHAAQEQLSTSGGEVVTITGVGCSLEPDCLLLIASYLIAQTSKDVTDCMLRHLYVDLKSDVVFGTCCRKISGPVIKLGQLGTSEPSVLFTALIFLPLTWQQGV